MIKAILLDCDNTVWDRKTGEVFTVPKQRLHALPRYVKLAFCTNQTSVGRRYWMKTGGWGNPERLKGERAIRSMYERLVVQEMGFPAARLYMAFLCRGKNGWGPAERNAPEWNPDWVKPSPGMLRQAAMDLGVFPEECVYIGDDLDDDRPDSGAAANAGVQFYQAPDIWEDKEFWEGFKYTQARLFELEEVKKEKDLSAFMDRGKLTHSEIMANLNRIAANEFVPSTPWVYRGKEWAQEQARAAVAEGMLVKAAVVEAKKKKRGKRK